jgi:hypothetical protein
LQKVRVNVVYNDLIPFSAYTLTVPSPPSAQGTTDVLPGGFIEFTPNASVIPVNLADTVNVTITYQIACGTMQQTSTLTVRVTKHNNPANIISADVACYRIMGSNIGFDVEKKFNTPQGPDRKATSVTAWYGIDAFSSPLVGDLNGDGKPEIVIMGTDRTAEDHLLYVKSVNIYNGQNGDLKHMAVLGSGEPSPAALKSTATPKLSSLLKISSNYNMGARYHRAPSMLALADVDGDGTGEIIYCDVQNSYVYALKPVFSGESITSVSVFWKSDVKYRPITGNTESEGGFVYPHPYIADLNGDGTPELIIYNKIYNARTGKLLMAWGGGADGTYSSHTQAELGAVANMGARNANPTEQANVAAIKKVAFTGRRPNNGGYTDMDLAVPAIIDLDGDGIQEIVTGNRIYKFNLNDTTGTAGNQYTIVNGPEKVRLPTARNKSSWNDYYLSDGFTRVADIDGDGKLDILAAMTVNSRDDDRTILIYLWDPVTKQLKAAVTFYANTRDGTFSIPFVGDINGKLDGWDGTGWTRKLPEICILTGGVYLTAATIYGGRYGLSFHPRKTDSELKESKFNKKPPSGEGHIIGLTYNGEAPEIEDRLQISWAMEHNDGSNNTGITLFDFDNDGAMDLCYRDMDNLRVISPGKSGKDYVPLSEDVGTGTSIMFKTNVYCNTGYEYPVIADINMDGSADILITGHPASNDRYAVGVVYAYQYKKYKWAPCPPVWNQSMYDPLQVRENLKINARPISMLSKLWDPIRLDSIQPYNGSWIQRPILKAGYPYQPLVRLPNAVMIDMNVTVLANPMKANVELTILNRGSASISATAPISFHIGSVAGICFDTLDVGVDIFPGETVTRTYSVSHSATLSGELIVARVFAENQDFPAAGFEDCDLTNNVMEASHCPHYSASTVAYPSTIVCGSNGRVKLSALTTYPSKGSGTDIQWYKDDFVITGASDSVLYVSAAGQYNYRIRNGNCIERTNHVNVTVDPSGPPVLELECSPAAGLLCRSGSATLSPRSIAGYSSPQYLWYKDDILQPGSAASFTATAAGLYRLNIVDGICMSSDTFRIKQIADTMPTMSNISAPPLICPGTSLTFTAPTVNNGGSGLTAVGWEWSAAAGGPYSTFNPAALSFADNGKYVRYWATNYCGTSVSNSVQISLAKKPAVSRINSVAAVCLGSSIVLPNIAVTENGSPVTSQGWQIETAPNVYANISLPYTPALADNGRGIRYVAENSCGRGYSDTATITVVAPPSAGTLSYNSGSIICTASSGESPAWTTTPTGGTGTYSANSPDLNIDPSSGAISPGTSAPGTYTVTYTVAAGVCPQFTTSAQVTIAVCTNLTLNASVPAPAAICENATDTIRVTVTNAAPVTAAGLILTDVFPSASLTLLSSHPSGTTGYAGGVWNIGTLAAGASAQLKLAVRGLSAGTQIKYQSYVSAANGVNAANYAAAAIRAEVALEVKSTPHVAVYAGGNVCVGSTVDLFAVAGGVAPWQISYSDGTSSRTLTMNSSPHRFTPAAPGDTMFQSVRVTAANGCDSASSVTSSVIRVGAPPKVSPLAIDKVCSGAVLTSGSVGLGAHVQPVAWNNSAGTSEGWRMETAAGQNAYQDFASPYIVTFPDEGKRIFYSASNSCGAGQSDTANIRIHPKMIYPDIRIQTCSAPARSIFLSGYLDTLNFKAVEWSAVSSGSSGFVAGTHTGSGELLVKDLAHGVHIYKYRIENECETGEAKAFVKNTTQPVVRSMSDTLIVCHSMPLSAHIQLNQILGMEATGTWDCSPDLSSFVSVSPAGSQFKGARILNAAAAWATLHSNPLYSFTYKNDSNAALFKFAYIMTNDPCMGNARRELVLIVTLSN